MKIISIDKVRLLSEDIRELQSMSEVILYSDSPKDINEVQERIRDADILIVNTYPLSPKELRFASHLKLVCVFGTGYDFIDTEYLKQNNILVCNAPRYSTESTAEHAVGLILHASRLVSKAERDLRNGVWSPHAYKGCEIKGRKIGIIGYGNIGKRISEIVKQGFGMDVEYVNSSSVRSELEHLLKTCDVISLNVSLNSKTKNLISDAEFDLMKDGVVIVNTSRGAVIDQDALIRNLTSGKVFAAGLDVLESEPISKDNPLLSFDNVVLTPHMGFKSMESEKRISEIVKNNTVDFIHGHPRNIVNLQ